MKKKKWKSTIVVVAVAVSSLCVWKAFDAYGTVKNSLLMENLSALCDGESGSHTRPCNVDLKKGNGVWRCGNPCVYEPHKVRRNNKPENESICYF